MCSNLCSVADVVRRAQCFERRRYKRCNCRTGKGAKAYNPCERSEAIAQAAEALDAGDTSKGTLEQVEEWLVKHTCHASREGRTCQHKGCMDREGAIDFVQQLQRSVAA
jgi:hypothetical protein